MTAAERDALWIFAVRVLPLRTRPAAPDFVRLRIFTKRTLRSWRLECRLVRAPSEREYWAVCGREDMEGDGDGI